MKVLTHQWSASLFVRDEDDGGTGGPWWVSLSRSMWRSMCPTSGTTTPR